MSDRGKSNEWVLKLSESKNGAKTSLHQIFIKNITLRFLTGDMTTPLPQTSRFPRSQGTHRKIYRKIS